MRERWRVRIAARRPLSSACVRKNAGVPACPAARVCASDEGAASVEGAGRCGRRMSLWVCLAVSTPPRARILGLPTLFVRFSGARRFHRGGVASLVRAPLRARRLRPAPACLTATPRECGPRVQAGWGEGKGAEEGEDKILRGEGDISFGGDRPRCAALRSACLRAFRSAALGVRWRKQR